MEADKNTDSCERKWKKALKPLIVLIDLEDVFVCAHECAFVCVCPEGNRVNVASHAIDWNSSQIMSSGYKTCQGFLTCVCLCACARVCIQTLTALTGR